MLLAVGTGAWLSQDSELVSRIGADYTTGVGEQRRVALASDLSLELNTYSAINAHGTDRGWHLRLISGEALIDTALSRLCLSIPLRFARKRPRRVSRYVSSTMAQPVGSLSRRASGDPDSSQHLDCPARRAGGAFRAAWDARSGVMQASAPAWAEGMIVANGQPLQAFLDELGRYRHGYLAATPPWPTCEYGAPTRWQTVIESSMPSPRR